MKGAFIYNFMKFVEWPPAAFTDPLVVGVLGSAPIEEIEAALEDKSVRGHRIVVRAVENAGRPGPCHVLFITQRRPGAASQRAARRGGHARAHRERRARRGPARGRDQPVAVDTRLGFQVNLELAEASGLQVSSKLLGLAKTVRGYQGKRP